MPGAMKNLKMSIPSCENFSACYMELCKQQRLRPLPMICLTLPYTLDFTTDRVKIDDWGPILNSLSLDKSLKIIKVKSKYHCRKLLDDANSEMKARSLGKSPVILSRYLLEWLTHSIAQCVRNSCVLTRLEIEGIPLPADCLAALCVGITKTISLKHLSLQGCFIGDRSCALVCKTIIDIQSIKSLNLSQCDLSSDCGPVLAAALSRQQLLLFHDTWKDSLRYRNPNLDAMPGLRRLTLNGNPHLGDQAVVEIIESIQDSLWLKAIDLQHCGITDTIADEIIDLLEINTTLEVFDVRLNNGLSPEIVEQIFSRIQCNHNGSRLQYRFLNIQPKNQRAVSAGVKPSNQSKNINNNSNKIRPKSAAFINAKINNTAALNKTLNTTQSILKKSHKLKTPVVLQKQQLKNDNEKILLLKKDKAKIGLHLDIQEKIKSVVEKNSSSVVNSKIKKDDEEKQDLLERELEVVKLQQEKLDDKIEKMELELQEERSRRIEAESRLQLMNDDLLELENTLKEKEYETRGYILISQQSFDEINDLFEKLLEMLDDLSRKPEIRWQNDDSSDNDETESIKRKVALILRQTKSESLQKTIDIPNIKFTKSTGDIQNNMTPLRIERDDVGDAANCQLLSQSYRSTKQEYSPFQLTDGDDREFLPTLRINQDDDDDDDDDEEEEEDEEDEEENEILESNHESAFSRRQRARQIFSQVVNNEVMLKIRSFAT
ncbi:centrosomal protein of 78 kDa [Aphidius gifuensis]|uniref:centrosomal protein of 78 kDa n=1 Tax=Aphidius gifuensis TaxID=684658 RepID=UPI001CDBA587|nr:centrosomal protein of 78 kDa [Aphidius gifuensis]